MAATRDVLSSSSFLAGVATASIAWCAVTVAMSSIRRNARNRSDGRSSDAPSPGLGDVLDTNRIGELPSSKTRPKQIPWPWMDTIIMRRSSAAAAQLIDTLSSFGLANGSNNDGEDQDAVFGFSDEGTESGREDEKKNDDDSDGFRGISSSASKGLCIGSIFGLDVGGTLAKLVYFEQRADEHEHEHNRREHYHQAASARAVLEARRSSSITRPHSRQSEADLERMWQLRQSSVPANLEEFGEETGLFPESDSSTAPNLALKHEQNGSIGETAAVAAAAAGATTRTPHNGIHEKRPSLLSKSFSTLTPGMKKSRSMLEMSVEKAEALDRFYNFARRLDTYETGVKDKHLSFYSRYLGGEMHFIRFETMRMRNAIDLIRVNNLHLNIAEMGATGGGAHKYEDDWKRILGVQMDKQDELDSLVAGMQFVLADVVGECYTFHPKRRDDHPTAGSGSFMSRSNHSSGAESRFSDSDVAESDETESDYQSDYHIGNFKADAKPHDADRKSSKKDSKVDEWWWSRKVQRDVVIESETYPYLLVTIGTGVSILRVDGPRKHERISGSTIGGGTYWGLCRLLTSVESFEDVINLAEKGDPSKVDMMVGDIYGKGSDALEKLGLPTNLVASSFGKLVAKQNPAEGLEQEDLARALLLMITNNIGQVAYLNAQLHRTKRIYFVGSFLRHNVISQKRLAFAINFWSGGKNEALFLEHEGYFGALGAFLLSQGIPHPTTSRKGNGNHRSHTRSRTQASRSDFFTVLETEHITSGRLRARTYSR